VALDVREESNDIWIWDLARQTLTRLTFDPELNRGVVWSPDGRRVAFSAVRDGSENVYWQPADGTGVLEALTREQRGAFPNSFSPDGKRLVFSQPPGTPPRDLGVVALDGDRKAELIVKSTFNEANGEISPDGRWLAYQSNESGRDEIYVRPFPDVTSGRWQVSNGGGTRPLWARNGRELFYYLEPGTVITVPIESGATFVAGTPNKALAGAYVAPLEGRTYDVSLDGRRFLMLKNAETTNQTATTPRIIVVQNWFEELKRRVPTN
jgi:serine/threonine-protein kinase